MRKDTWQERLLREMAELQERLGKLQAFIMSGKADELDGEDKWLLVVQEANMVVYLDVLMRRVDRIKGAVEIEGGE